MRATVGVLALACATLLWLLRTNEHAAVDATVQRHGPTSSEPSTAGPLLATKIAGEEDGRLAAVDAAPTNEPEVNAAQPDTGSLVVHVVDDTGRALTGTQDAPLTVELRQLGNRWHTADADATGRALFEGVDPGRYQITLDGLAEELHEPAEGLSVRLEAGTQEDVTYTCRRGGTLIVVISGPGGAPVEGTRVRLDSIGHRGRVGARFTDAAGRATFTDAYPGRYLIELQHAPDSNWAERVQPAPSVVEVMPGRALEHRIEFPAAGVAIRVLVQDPTARPIEAVPVVLRHRVDAGSGVATELGRAVTDDLGQATFEDCPKTLVEFAVPIDPVPEEHWGTAQAILLRKPPEPLLVDLRELKTDAPLLALQVEPEPEARRVRIRIDPSKIPAEAQPEVLWSQPRILPRAEEDFRARTPPPGQIAPRAQERGVFVVAVRARVEKLHVAGVGFYFAPDSERLTSDYGETFDLTGLAADGRSLSTLRPVATRLLDPEEYDEKFPSYSTRGR